MRFQNTDGTWLTLGVLGALAAATAAAKRRPKRLTIAGYRFQPGDGSFNARTSPFVQMVNRLYKVYGKQNPETFIRATDLIFALHDSDNERVPGLSNSTAELELAALEIMYPDLDEPDARQQAEAEGIVPLQEYAKFMLKMIRDNTYHEVLHTPGLDVSEGVEWAWGPYAPWIARELHKMMKAKKRGQIDDWQVLDTLQSWTRTNSGWPYIADLLAGGAAPVFGQQGQITGWNRRGIDVNRYSFDQMIQISREYHQRAAEQANKDKLKRLVRQGKISICKDGLSESDPEVVYTFPNGWTIRELKTKKEHMDEGHIGNIVRVGGTTFGGGCLHHCIGDHGYVEKAQKGQVRNFSLRTPSNRPVSTMTIDANGRVEQAKGFYNRFVGARPDASHAAYHKNTILRDTAFAGLANLDPFLDFEASAWLEFIPTVGGNPSAGYELTQANNRVAVLRQKDRKAGQRQGQAGPYTQAVRVLRQGGAPQSARAAIQLLSQQPNP